MAESGIKYEAPTVLEYLILPEKGFAQSGDYHFGDSGAAGNELEWDDSDLNW